MTLRDKPQQFAQLNSSHVLSGNMKYAFLFQGLTPTQYDIINCTQGVGYDYGGNDLWHPDGMMFDADNGSSSSEYFETNIPASRLNVSVQPFSLAYGFKRYGVSPNTFEYHAMGNTYTTLSIQVQPSGSSSFRYAGDTVLWNSIDPFSSDPYGYHSFVFSIDSNGGCNITVDGFNRLTDTFSVGGAPTSTLKIGGRYDAVDRYSNGIFHYFYYFDKILTLEECSLLHSDPYGMFYRSKPVPNIFYVSGGGSSENSYYYQANQ